MIHAMRSAVPILQSINDAGWEAVARLFAAENFPRERLVFQEGDVGEKFYIIVRGRVSVSRMGVSGQEQRLAILEDGDFFGEVALLKRAPRTATVRTITDCVLLSLSTDHLTRIFEEHPGLRADVEAVMLKRLSGQRGES